MTEQEQRIAIAEFCGWKPENTISPLDGKTELTLWWNSPQKVVCASGPPDYLHDLNAIQDAVLSLPENKRNDYMDYLRDIASFAGDYGWYEANAMASQRAEALLKTIGKWKD